MTNEIPLSDVVDILHHHQVPPSIQRLTILKYLIEHPIHPNVDKIYNALNEELPTLSRTTVYNTLKLLSDHKVIQTLTIDEHNNCYDANVRPHAHFQCRKCGRIYDLGYTDGCDLCSTGEREGFLVEEAQLYYKGICRSCREEEEANAQGSAD